MRTPKHKTSTNLQPQILVVVLICLCAVSWAERPKPLPDELRFAQRFLISMKLSLTDPPKVTHRGGRWSVFLIGSFQYESEPARSKVIDLISELRMRFGSRALHPLGRAGFDEPAWYLLRLHGGRKLFIRACTPEDRHQFEVWRRE